jgi:hypothetical protein
MAKEAYITVTADIAGGTFPVEIVNPTADYVLILFNGSGNISSDIIIPYTTTPVLGQRYTVYIQGGAINLNGHQVNVFGLPISQAVLDSSPLIKLNLQYIQPTTIGGFPFIFSWYDHLIDYDTLDGASLLDGTVTLVKLEALASGKTIVGDGSNIPVADYIKNANIDASAGIARTKIASGTPDQVVVNASHTGALDSVAQLPPALGGTGLNSSSSTGFPIISSGTWSAGALTETIRVDVSFATASQGTYYVALPACTVTKVKARVTSAIAGTDDATITCQNASSTNMANGLVTLPASSAHGTGVSVTPSANNTLSAGAEMQLVVSKVTQGGTASVDITFTRTALT